LKNGEIEDKPNSGLPISPAIESTKKTDIGSLQVLESASDDESNGVSNQKSKSTASDDESSAGSTQESDRDAQSDELNPSSTKSLEDVNYASASDDESNGVSNQKSKSESTGQQPQYPIKIFQKSFLASIGIFDSTAVPNLEKEACKPCTPGHNSGE